MGIKAGMFALAAAFTPHAEAAEPAAQPTRVCEMTIGNFNVDKSANTPPPLLGPGVTHITLKPRQDSAPVGITPPKTQPSCGRT